MGEARRRDVAVSAEGAGAGSPRAELEIPSPPDRRGFVFTGSGREYFRIWIVNLLFTVLTLGIYSPWAKVRKAKYFWQNTRLDGHVRTDLEKLARIVHGGNCMQGTQLIQYPGDDMSAPAINCSPRTLKSLSWRMFSLCDARSNCHHTLGRSSQRGRTCRNRRSTIGSISVTDRLAMRLATAEFIPSITPAASRSARTLCQARVSVERAN